MSGLARRHVTVALTGDGGDELFCGYRRYVAMQLEERLRGAPAGLRAAARSRAGIELLRRVRRKALANDLAHSRRFRDRSVSDLYLSRIEALGPDLKARLYEDGFATRLAGRDARRTVLRALASSDAETLAERCAHADVQTYLPDDILVKVDVASMAHGLECRAPLLDHLLAEYVAGLPFRLKMSGLRRKAVLKGAVRERLPDWVLTRRKKGFSIPLQTWFQGDMGPLLDETLLSKRAAERGYLRRERVGELLDEHARGVVNHQAPLFCLLMLELWHRIWIDPPRGRSPESPAVVEAQLGG